MQHLLTVFFILLTLLCYNVARHIYFKYNSHPLLNIVCWSVAALIAFLLIFDIPYAKYEPAKNIMTLLLGPSTVALALPLYRYRTIVRQQAGPILGCVIVGSLLAMLSATLLSKFGGLPRDVVMSIIAKGVSIPFALEISQMYGGIPALAVAFVVATGTFGAVFGAWLLNRFGIDDPVARGLSYGTVSHAQGTATALMEGEKQGAMSGLALILAGIITAALSPIVVSFLDLF